MLEYALYAVVTVWAAIILWFAIQALLHFRNEPDPYGLEFGDVTETPWAACDDELLHSTTVTAWEQRNNG